MVFSFVFKSLITYPKTYTRWSRRCLLLGIVFHDHDVDTLADSQGQDWFFASKVADNGGVLDVRPPSASDPQRHDDRGR